VVVPAGPISLAQLAPGHRARVEAIQGGRGLVSRLAALGLVPGTLVTVLNSAGGGPVILEVRGGRLALGRGQAARILVRVVA
jgi:Fe2+ transport system protein FeoA